MYLPLLPHPGEALTETDWLDRVKRLVQEEFGLLITPDELRRLWKIARQVVNYMDTEFRHPGRKERCYGCWKRLKCDYSDGCVPPASLPPEGYCNFWYGSTGIERMYTLRQREILAGLLMAWDECRRAFGDVSSEVFVLEQEVSNLMDNLLLHIKTIKTDTLANMGKIKKSLYARGVKGE